MRLVQGEWLEDPTGYQTGHCTGAQIESDSEDTFTEWEVRDLNGDGYPDFVFNSAPAHAKTFQVAANLPAPNPPSIQYGTVTVQDTLQLTPVGTNELIAAFNILGTHVDASGAAAFSALVLLRAAAECGIGHWVGSTSGTQQLVCGLADVNGDGITDLVNPGVVFLGTGNLGGLGFFTLGSVLTLPGPLAAQDNQQVSRCAPPATGNTTFHVTETAGLRDLTGDGIPDYVSFNGASWSVSIGTGTGFTTAIPISAPGVNAALLSDVIDDCAGIASTTSAGLYDLHATGTPVFVTGTPSASVQSMLVGSTGVAGGLDAGRLVAINNGFGAKTTITYHSAKDDTSTLHLLSSPEVVVSAVETTGTQGLGGTLSKTQYAYGGASLVFDSARDAFTFPGYRRSVELQITGAATQGVAVITDRYGLDAPPSGTVSANERHGRYLRAGRVSDVTMLSGVLAAAPESLLGVDVTNDARRIGGTHDVWASLGVAVSAGTFVPYSCLDMVFPYDHAASVQYAQSHPSSDGYDACWEPAFAYQASAQSWRGDPGAAPPSTANVETRSEVSTIDDFGRITSAAQRNDLNRSDDDVCTTTTYASPGTSSARILTAVATAQVSNCGTVTLAGESWIYDGLAAGNVSAGLLSSHSVERRAEGGALLATVKDLVIASRDVFGNPTSSTTTREDGAVRKLTLAYDKFALAPVTIRTDATGTTNTVSTILRDPLTLSPLTVTDPNGTQYGATYDGFDRVVLSTVKPNVGTIGAMAVTSYEGFSTPDPQGRRVTRKVFTDPVALASAPTAVGRSTTVFLDELGRERRAERKLGADYANETLVIGQRTYDNLGRVVFEADPFPASQSFATAYGTTQYFNVDGTPSCSIRGNGVQPSAAVTDEAHEVYRTCLSHAFQDHTEVVSSQDAASLLTGSPQDGVIHASYSTAIGQLVARSTWQGTNRLEHATFTQDALGRLTSMTRYQDPVAATKPVTTSWHFDSLGQLVELDEPNAAAQLRTYSNWGELLQLQWTDPTTPTPTDHRVVSTYDGLGRITHQEERTGTVVDPDTIRDYAYDLPVNVAPQVTPTNVRGRLAQATWPTGGVTLSYDSFGQVNAQTFSDNQGGLYVETHAFHADGSLSAIDLLLPDTAFADERVDYSQDSAGRARSVKFTSAGQTNTLFTASTIDPWGRVRQAQYGNTAFAANFDDTGRRLLRDVTVSSVLAPTTSRKISYPALDPVGRERSRTETKNGATSGTKTAQTYDAIGRLSTSNQTLDATTLLARKFGYDPLGNITGQGPPSGPLDATAVALSYLDTDRDRICRIGYGTGGLGGTACNVKYDGVGNLTELPTRNGIRQLSYFASGNVRSITRGTTVANFRYDAFGDVQELTVDSTTSSDTRHDRHYGSMIAWRDETGGGAITSVLTRKIPGPSGFFATRHGPGGKWSFEFGEARGGRYVTDENGTFVQEAEYSPYGEAKLTGSQSAPGKPMYSTSQWNGGDALTALGVSQLGARLYDPVLGRFLSRDPLLIPRTAATTNPYAFANNDPVNGSDPSGLDCIGKECSSSGGTEPGQQSSFSSHGWSSWPISVQLEYNGGGSRGYTHGHYHPQPAAAPAAPAADPAQVRSQINLASAAIQSAAVHGLRAYAASGGLWSVLADDVAPRALGGANIVAGAVIAGVSTGLCTTGIGCVIAGLGIAYGTDLAASGAQQAYYGGSTTTQMNRAVASIAGQQAANDLELAFMAATTGSALAQLAVPGAAVTVRAAARVIGATGRVGEEALNALGGQAQVYFRTSLGGRFVDQLVGRVAHESKVGYTVLTRDVARQIAKDAELIGTGRIDGAVWHFFESPVTGAGGPSDPLRAALKGAGIGIVIY